MQHLKVIRQNEFGRLQHSVNGIRAKYPRIKYLALAGLFVGGIWTLDQGAKAQRAQEVSEFYKSQLQKTPYVLTEGELTNFPWTEKNYDLWDHRIVQITGRPKHNQAVLIESISFGLRGFQYIVPVVTKEDADLENQEGIFVNLGFLPESEKYPCQRERIENVEPQTFTCYVSKLEKWQEHGPLEGNCPDVARNKWTHADLEQMAKKSGLKNVKQVQIAALESVKLNTRLDEKHWRLNDISSDYKQQSPYAQTLAGALQQPVAPWDSLNKRSLGLNILTVHSLFTGALWCL